MGNILAHAACNSPAVPSMMTKAAAGRPCSCYCAPWSRLWPCIYQLVCILHPIVTQVKLAVLGCELIVCLNCTPLLVLKLQGLIFVLAFHRGSYILVLDPAGASVLSATRCTPARRAHVYGRGLCCGNLTSAPKSMLARGMPAGVARGVVIGVVRGVDTLRWGFSGSHMRCSMKPRRSAGRLMRATFCLMASSATAVATCRRAGGLPTAHRAQHQQGTQAMPVC